MITSYFLKMYSFQIWASKYLFIVKRRLRFFFNLFSKTGFIGIYQADDPTNHDYLLTAQ